MCFLYCYWSLDLLCLQWGWKLLRIRANYNLVEATCCWILDSAFSKVELGLPFMSWIPRKTVRRAQCLSLGWMLSLLAVGQFALYVRVMRSLPISIPRTTAFPDKVVFAYSLLSLLKLFNYPTNKSGVPKVEGGSKRSSASIMDTLQGTHVREVFRFADGEVACRLLGT